MLLVGSQALRKNGIRIPRKSLDLDMIVTEEEASALQKQYSSFKQEKTKSGIAIHTDTQILDLEVAKKGSSGYDLLRKEDALEDLVVASPDTVYTLKMSHRYLKDSPHFYKTMNDIHYLRKLGCMIPKGLSQNWFKKREEETYDYNHPNLNVKKEDFFDETEDFYVYDHDSIHLTVAQRDYPAYLDFKPVDQAVLCSKEMFDECSNQVKLNSVVEEAMVLTLERCLIPNDFKPNERKVFQYALMKVCTSITSGWWREWAWEHFKEAMDYYDSLGSDKYIENSFKNGLSCGLVKPFRGERY